MGAPLIELHPELVWTEEGRFAAAVGVGIDPATGRIARVGAPVEGAQRLPRRALIPAFVNAHSHAFQRAMRGRTEHLRADQPDDDFWTWREAMYGLADSLTTEQIYSISRLLYGECLRAGYGTVGEFHYLHHGPDGARHEDDPLRSARAVIEAGLDAGVRIALLVVLYERGGFGRAAAPRQRRFLSASVAEFGALVEGLLREYGGHPGVTIGLAPHSVRAVSAEGLAALAARNREWGLPVHMHLCEQPQEVQDALYHTGAAPIALVARAGLLDQRLVAVHATHLQPDDPQRLADAGAMVCACPTTEANLGDGVLPALELLSQGVPLCIGSDSHALVNPLEELRLIENNERLQRRRRNVLAGLQQPGPQDERLSVAPGLLDVGTRHGARALAVEAGQIAPGLLADLVAIDLDSPPLRDVPAEALAEALVFSGDPRVVDAVWIGGRQVL